MMTKRRLADLILVPALNMAAAFSVTAVLFVLVGEDPVSSAGVLLAGAFGSGEALGYTLYYATNFIFTGLAFAVSFQAGLFNIGAEGQASLAGLALALPCLYLPHLPFALVLVLATGAAALGGAAWAFIPGYLQAYRGSHVVVTTILLNFIAAALMIYILSHVLAAPGAMQPETPTFAPSTHLPSLKPVLQVLGLNIGTAPLNISFIWALLCALGVGLLLWRTTFGYALRVLGQSASVAAYAGLNVRRLTITVMMISGALAGFMALNEVMGAQNRVVLEFTAGYGFVGIAVGLMGRCHPLGIVFAALLFGALYQGGAELSFEHPAITRDMIVFIQGLIIFFVGALEHMFRPRVLTFFAKAGAA